MLSTKKVEAENQVWISNSNLEHSIAMIDIFITFICNFYQLCYINEIKKYISFGLPFKPKIFFSIISRGNDVLDD